MPETQKEPKAARSNAARPTSSLGSADDATSEWKPAIYRVQLDPPHATLTVKDGKGVVTGYGRYRQVQIDHRPLDGFVILEAICPSYRQSYSTLTPQSGTTADVNIRLDKAPELTTAPPTAHRRELPLGLPSNQTLIAPISFLRGHTRGVQYLAFSPDGRLAASGADDQSVRLWNLQESREIWTKTDFLSPIGGLQFGQDGKKVFAADRANVWELQTDTGEGRRIFHIPLTSNKNNNATVAFNSACTLIAAHRAGKAVLCDIRRDRVLVRMNEWIRCFAFLPNDTGVLGALEDMRVLSFQSGQVRPATSKPQFSYCESIAISPDGSRVVSGTGRCFKIKGIPPDANRVRVWDLRNGQLLHDLQDHRQWVWAVAFVAEGKYILSGGGGCNEDFGGFRPDADHAIRLWDANTGTLLQTVDAHRSAVFSLAVSKDGRYALSGSTDGTIVLWTIGPGSISTTGSATDAGPERALAEWVLARGGSVLVGSMNSAVDEYPSYQIHTASDLPSYSFTVKEISFHGKSYIGDDDLIRLKDAKYLQKLWLSGTSVGSIGLQRFENFADLRELYLGGAPVDDLGMISISRFTKLQFLGLHGTKVTDIGIRSLGSLKELKTIRVSETEITDDAVRETLPNCVILR